VFASGKPFQQLILLGIAKAEIKHLDGTVPNSDFPVLHSLNIAMPVSGIISYQIRIILAKKLTISELRCLFQPGQIVPRTEPI
jgi:hypothetical protein